MPRAHLFGGKKGFEDPFPGLLVHADAGIGDGEPDTLSHGLAGDRGRQLVFGHSAGLRGQSSPARHGGGGVGPEVEQKLLHLAPVRVDRRQPPGQIETDVDAPVGSGKGLGHCGDELIQIKRGQLEVALTGVAEKFPGEGGAALDAFLNGFELGNCGGICPRGRF